MIAPIGALKRGNYFDWNARYSRFYAVRRADRILFFVLPNDFDFDLIALQSKFSFKL